jgi:iron(III) transport system ATP-binding protein
MNPTEPSSLELRTLSVTIDDQQKLRELTLNILPGELFVLLGAAGAGKSAVLRAIAGLDPVADGEIWIDEMDITTLPAHQRQVALMAQSFPLWPNLTVAKNVGFALDRKGRGRSEVRERVDKELAAVGLGEFRRHLPLQLSPSQQQRVALARTLAADARVNLLDEPFDAQDLQLRERLLLLLKRRQQQSTITTLVTTRDPHEALRLGDRIALLRDGELQQVGSPRQLYDTPANRYVAEYLGDANLIEGNIEYAGDQALFQGENGIVVPLFEQLVKRSRTGAAMFRPHDLAVVPPDAEPFGDEIRFNGRIEQVEFRGDTLRYAIDLSGKTVWMDIARGSRGADLEIGDQLVVGIDPARIRILEN